ncbi:MAG: hypothetical protein M5R42_14965 [Rhodocyclaceae bacterium]|nr:hypothetical protein [Rhodocyclaceae bacterium]
MMRPLRNQPAGTMTDSGNFRAGTAGSLKPGRYFSLTAVSPVPRRATQVGWPGMIWMPACSSAAPVRRDQRATASRKPRPPSGITATIWPPPTRPPARDSGRARR